MSSLEARVRPRHAAYPPAAASMCWGGAEPFAGGGAGAAWAAASFGPVQPLAGGAEEEEEEEEAEEGGRERCARVRGAPRSPLAAMASGETALAGAAPRCGVSDGEELCASTPHSDHPSRLLRDPLARSLPSSPSSSLRRGGT
ncbi:unnamed protein product [Prorocentrum cordatum]|uniref:Uncharacterized protein n=1 Tax=Prorocentrum cordatum TaxID=2364126 RepID=A0ABN9QVG3_9DINO|nr:unnamed protein product [Polarella glacialis]